jgi:hypothetical protein
MTMPATPEALARMSPQDLAAEFNRICEQRDHYRNAVTNWLQADWNNVQESDLPMQPGPHSSIDDIIADLMQVPDDGR